MPDRGNKGIQIDSEAHPVGTMGIKRQGREANQSPSSSAEVNAWSYNSTLPHVFMAWYLAKHRATFVDL